MRGRFLPLFSLAGGVLALSFSPIFVRWAQAPGPVTSFYRMLTAVVILAPLAVHRIRRERGSFHAGAVALGLLGGLLTAGDHGFWSSALSSTSVANATLFNYVAPLWVALFAVLVWKERLRGRFWLGLGLVLAGMAVVIGAGMDREFRFNPGDIFAVVSSFFYAAYFLTAQRGRRSLPAEVFVWLVAVGAALGLLAVCLAGRMPLTGYSGQTALAFILAGLFSQVGGYFLVAYALGHLPAAVVAPTMIAQPVLSALLAIPVAGETLSAGQLLGGAAVLIGIAVVNREHA